MPPLVCPSPIILDHSFPDSTQTLQEVLGALGNLQQKREAGELIIIASPIFPLFISEISWEKILDYPELRDIHRFLTTLFLQPNQTYMQIDTDALPQGGLHPLPVGCKSTELSELWRVEAGKIRAEHDRIARGHPFAGIACHLGFSGLEMLGYPQPIVPHLPLVGLHDLGHLDSGTCWITDPNILNQPIRLRDAQRNLHLLRGTISPVPVGSHYSVHFPGARRPWVLDVNFDPLIEDYAKEICPLVDKPLEYVKHVLINGDIPLERLKLT